MPLLKFIPFICVFILLSCNGSSESTENTSKKSETKVKAANSKKSCLEQYTLNPCEILDLEKVAGIAGVSATDLEMKLPDERYKNSTLRVCKYTWSTGRKLKVKVGSSFMEVDASNDILIGLFNILDREDSRVKPPYTDWFDRTHRQITKKEETELKEKAKKKLEEEQGEEQAKIGGELLDGILKMGSEDQYVDFEDIGDRANARISGKSPDVYLDILHGNLTFRIVVNVSNDKTKNLEIAKNLGSEIISLCD